MGNLLTLKQVATTLGLSEQRIYQMDKELRPVFIRRGSKMKSRLYKPEVVKSVLDSRARPATPSTPRYPDRLWRSLVEEGCALLTQETAASIAVKPCHFCYDTEGELRELVRVDGSHPHSPMNSVPACRECVRWMGERDGNAFMKRVRAIRQADESP